MSVLRILSIAVILLFLGSTGWAESTAKEGAKEIGRGFKTMGTQTGKAVKEGGKEVGQGLKKVGEGTGRAAKVAGKETYSEAKHVGRVMWDEARRIGRSVRDWGVGTYQKASQKVQEISGNIQDYFKKGEK